MSPRSHLVRSLVNNETNKLSGFASHWYGPPFIFKNIENRIFVILAPSKTYIFKFYFCLWRLLVPLIACESTDWFGGSITFSFSASEHFFILFFRLRLLQSTGLSATELDCFTNEYFLLLCCLKGEVFSCFQL